MSDYHSSEYWKTRFQAESSFDWLISSKTFMDIILPFCNDEKAAGCRVLQLGFGTSDLHLQLRRAGLTVTNVDFEATAILHGKAAETESFGDVIMEYIVADATALPPFKHSFDLVVDKSTVDAISCAGDDALLSTLSSVRATLTARSVWICCSYSSQRFQNLRQSYFTISPLQTIAQEKSNLYDPDIFTWIYVLRPI